MILFIQKMSIKQTIQEDSGVYFITFTCVKWIPLIQITNGYSLIYDWYRYLQKSGHFIISYVIMPNHVHTIIAYRKSNKTMNELVGNGKRFIAYGIVKKLNELKMTTLLNQLSSYVIKSEKKNKKLHEIFEPSFDHKDLRSIKFIQQKANYIHHNPIKSGLSEIPEAYEHSSANYYLNGIRGHIDVITYMELQDIDLNKPIEAK
jgi:REP element-mobilizing transposase RayT